MKKLKKEALLILLLLLSVVTFSQVKTDYDKSTDFKKLKTYSFTDWDKGSDAKLSSFDKKRILDAFENELNSRGMIQVDSNADISIVLYFVVSKEKSVTAYTDYTTPMGFKGRRWGWASSYGTAITTYDESYYNEGTLVASFYNNSTKDLAWQGVSKTTIDSSAKKREKTIPKHIKKLLKEYPIKPINTK